MFVTASFQLPFNLCHILEVTLVLGFVKLKLNKMSKTEEDFLFKESALFYYQLTMIFTKMFCDRM